MSEAEDAEAQKLMAEMNLGDVESDDEDESETIDPEEIMEKFRRDVTISPDNAVDVIVLGTSDLDKAVEDFEKMTSVKPVWVTSMNGAGTKSARAAFHSCCYLELIGPDPKQSNTPFSEALAKLPAGELVPVHYSVRLEKASKQDTRMEWKKMGLDYDQVTMVAKDKGMPWLWDMYFFKGENGLAPFFTYWKEDMIHASSKLPIVGDLESVTVSAPDGHCVHKLLDSPSGVDLSSGGSKLEFTFSSPNGSHTFTTDEPIGVSFPDEGGISTH